MTGLAQVAFPGRADGSLVEQDGTVVGSSLIGQSFDGEPEYFQSRPSAAGDGYDPLASSASNLGPENPDLVAAIEERRAAAAELDGTDPDRGRARRPAGQRLRPRPAHQPGVRRAAGRPGRPRARPVRRGQVRALVDEHTDGRTLGFLGEPRVNVLLLNLALDEATGQAD